MKAGYYKERAWIEVNLAHLEHNVRQLQKIMPESCELMAVVKTDAYGHGAVLIAKHLNRIGVHAFAVATIDEGIQLRKAGIHGMILILGYTGPERIRDIKNNRLTQTVVDYKHAIELSVRRVRIRVHLKIDTGMHRLGIPFDSIRDVQSVIQMKYLNVTGIYSHLSCADSEDTDDIAFTRLQIVRFQNLIDTLNDNGIQLPKLHLQSSYGLLNYPDLKYDYVRCGIALYGVLSSASDKPKVSPDLRPVLSVKARVTHLQNVNRGEAIGYGRTFICERDSIIATVSIGYGDGLPRNMYPASAGIMINEKIAPLAGRISMDQLMVDVTDIKSVKEGNIVTVINDQNSCVLSVQQLAESSGTITNELLCRLGCRIKH